MTSCEGPRRPFFDDPTYYCPRTGDPVDAEICDGCREACEAEVERRVDEGREAA